MSHFTDTQYLSEGAVEQQTAEEQAIWEEAYGDVTQWIGDNAASRKIAYVAHTGDLIENDIRPLATPEMQRQVTGGVRGLLEAAGHPRRRRRGQRGRRGQPRQPARRENGPTARFNDYFGPDRYRAAAQRWNGAEYGGHWRAGTTRTTTSCSAPAAWTSSPSGCPTASHRRRPSGPTRSSSEYKDRNGILLSHDYLRPSSNPDGRGAGFSAPDGSPLYKDDRRGQPERLPDPRRPRARRRHQPEGRTSA